MPSPSIPNSSLSSLSPAPKISNIGRSPTNPPSQAEVLSQYRPSINLSNRIQTRTLTLGQFWTKAFLGRKTDKNPNETLAPGSTFVVKKSAVKTLLDQDNQKKADSPYYRGLLANTSPSNSYNVNFPERAHSYAASTTFTKSSFTSTIVTKLQEYGNSCFRFRTRKESEIIIIDDASPKEEASSAGLRNRGENSTTTAVASSSSPSKIPSESPFASTETKISASSSEKKPLRESVVDYSGQDSDRAEPEHQHEPIITVLPLEEAREKGFIVGAGEEVVREFQWADRYRPKALEDFICNKSKANELQAMARNKECGHFIFQGPPGVGKRTMIWALLREAFGLDSIQAKDQFKVFSLKGEVVGSVEVAVRESPRLVEVNLSEIIKGYEKHVIFELIRETSHKMPNKLDLPCKPPDNCRAIIFYGVDKLSSDAILYVKWLLERHKMLCMKIFFCCTDVSKLQAIKSLCTIVQLLPPSRTEIIEVLKFIAGKEGIDLPHQLAEKITDISKNNLRQAIRSFEATWLKHYPFKEDQQVLTGWEDDIANIAKKIVHEQSPKQLYFIRGKLQGLGEHDVSPDFIFQSLVDELKKHLDDVSKRRLHDLYMEYSKIDERMFENDKAIIARARNIGIQRFLRIEEFIAKFMSWYKTERPKSAQNESQDYVISDT